MVSSQCFRSVLPPAAPCRWTCTAPVRSTVQYNTISDLALLLFNVVVKLLLIFRFLLQNIDKEPCQKQEITSSYLRSSLQATPKQKTRTQVWTICMRWLLRRLTHPYTSTSLSRVILRNMVSTTIKVPVRPTPALQCTTTGPGERAYLVLCEQLGVLLTVEVHCVLLAS